MTTMEITSDIILALFISFIATLGTGFLGIKIARFTGLIDWPGTALHKQHTHPTPLAGGIVLVLSLLVTSLIFHQWVSREIIGTFLAAAIILAFGLWDDAKGLSASIKLGGQILAVTIAIYMGIKVEIFGNPSFIDFTNKNINIIMNWIVTYFWLIGITNAFNLVDSMDGIVSGLSSLTCLFFILATFASQQTTLFQWSAIMLGICIGIYLYNAPPARFFLGDSGAQTLGFLLAVIALLYSPFEVSQGSSWFVPIMFMSVPIFDTTLVVFSRLRRRKPVYQGHLDHTYHRLISLGVDSSRAVLFMHLTVFCIDCLALIAFSLAPLYANIIFFISLLLGISIIIILDSRKIWS